MNKLPFETFEKIVNELDGITTRTADLYRLGVDVANYENPFWTIQNLFLKGLYGEKVEWFFWFCYENDFGRAGLEAWDADKNPICRTVRELWELLEG